MRGGGRFSVVKRVLSAEVGYFGSVDQQEVAFKGRVFDFELIFVCFLKANFEALSVIASVLWSEH